MNDRIAQKNAKAQESSEEMLLVSKGFFEMGSHLECSYRDEKPVHEVYLESFLIDAKKVCREDYRQFLAALDQCDGHHPDWCHPDEPEGKSHVPGNWQQQLENSDMPVTEVDWYDAWSYSRWIGKKLPTEAQWEKNCKIHQYFLPYEKSIAKFNDKIVGKNILGKGWEWCLDDYHWDYYLKSPEVEPCCQIPSPYKSVRGSAYSMGLPLMRSTFRNRFSPLHRDSNLGFRCALPL